MEQGKGVDQSARHQRWEINERDLMAGHHWQWRRVVPIQKHWQEANGIS